MARQPLHNSGYPKILLAEDDRELRNLLGWVLYKAGYEVTECHNGIELLETLNSSLERQAAVRFDLVISDVQIPVMGPLEILEQLGDRSRCPPVVLITSFADDQLRNAAYRQGVAAVIDKPFDTDVFLEAIHQLIVPRLRNQRSDGGVLF